MILDGVATETLLFVSDFEAAVHFYSTQLGLKLIQKEEWGFALFEADEAGKRLSILTNAHHQEENGRRQPMLVYEVKNLEQALDSLKAQGVPATEIKGGKGQTRFAYFYDVDRNPFFIWENGQS